MPLGLLYSGVSITQDLAEIAGREPSKSEKILRYATTGAYIVSLLADMKVNKLAYDQRREYVRTGKITIGKNKSEKQNKVEKEKNTK